jgi:hypothetical protein
VKPRLSWHDKRGRVYVHPSIKDKATRRRLIRHEKTFLRERAKGKSRTEAIRKALISEHRGLSKAQVRKYEGRLGAQQRRIQREYVRPARPIRERPKREYARPERPPHITAYQWAQKRLMEQRMEKGKELDGYGRVDGKQRRWRLVGSGYYLNKAIRKAVWKHPPKKKYDKVRVDAYDVYMHPREYADYQEDWDFDRPEEIDYP